MKFSTESNNNMDYSQKSSAYFSLISVENIFQAWQEFKKGKRNKKDVQVFERHLEDNLFDQNEKLRSKTFKHSTYQDFYVSDPKRRHIHKAAVSDRIVHHLLYKYLYALFDKTFIFDSYSCRIDKGTHRAVKRLEKFSRKLSKNYTKDFWALKLDIKQFFASVDHEILMKIIAKKVKDKNILWLIHEILSSFRTDKDKDAGVPLGNLTSQIFANLYLNELDQFVKHNLKIKYYIRYADDFIILDQNQANLYRCIDTLKHFIHERLKLELHPAKICLIKLSWGIDFCGYIVLSHYRLPRTMTKKRIFNKALKSRFSYQTLQSYLGYFSHANSYRLRNDLKNAYYLTP